MTDLTETSTFTAGVVQLETTDPVLGGPGGKANEQAQSLVNRTKYLKDQLDGAVADIAALESDVADLEAAVGGSEEYFEDFVLTLGSWTNTGAFTIERNLFTLPARHRIVSVHQHITAAWARGAANGVSLYVTVGITGSNSKFFGTSYNLSPTTVDVGVTSTSWDRAAEHATNTTQITASLVGGSFNPHSFVTGGSVTLRLRIVKDE
jgi:hypothetical protein